MKAQRVCGRFQGSTQESLSWDYVKNFTDSNLELLNFVSQ